MKIGDLVRYQETTPVGPGGFGIIIGFSDKGNGGKEFVHVLKKDGGVEIFMRWQLDQLDQVPE